MQTLVLLWALLSCCGDVLVQAQEIGFYSIDCGSASTKMYEDPVTTIQWTPDSDIMTEGLTETGITPPPTEPGTVFTSLRYFPGNYSKYCYPLSPVAAGGTYIVRASFWMGQTTLYQTQLVSGQVSFQLIIDTYVAANVRVSVPQTSVEYLELYVTANTSSMTACVARTAGSDDGDPPFISGLELRPLPSRTYGGAIVQSVNYPLLMIGRSNYGVASTDPSILRYPDDQLDRIWYQNYNFNYINTSVDISTSDNRDQVPQKVVQDSFLNVQLIYTQVDQLEEHFFIHAIYFAEINPSVDASGLRVFDIAANGDPLVTGVDVYASVGAFKAMEIVNVTQTKSGWINITFNAAVGSTYDPFIAGIEVFQVLDSSIPFGTYAYDVVAIQDFVSSLNTISGYKGDPCLPSNYKFPWLNCSDVTPIRIVGIDLSNYNLVGNIPASINNLSEITTISLNANNLQGEIPELTTLINLEYLDLSNNNLTGPIPTSLSTLPNLKTLYLQNNELSGVIPPALLKNTNLEFKYTGNKNLCETNSNCVTQPPPSMPPPSVVHTPTPPSSTPNVGIIVGVVVGVLILVVIVIFIVVRRCKKRVSLTPTSPEVTDVKSPKGDILEVGLTPTPPHLPREPNPPRPNVRVARIFTYEEITRATRNFSYILGKGGSGQVYNGTLLDGSEVAIKVVSGQDRVEFETEATLLSTVHHRSIVQFLGYCLERRLALVYELMPRGSFYDALLGPPSDTPPLSWKERLSIMGDTAQGLDYLHRQCAPAIVHRDVKSRNILLGPNLEGKLGDLGASTDNFANTTRVIGSPGYIDPEYAKSLILSPMVDVYSFGVVLFEIITGKAAIFMGNEGQDVSLVDWVHPLIGRGDLDQLVDSRIMREFNEDAMWDAIDIAINCTKLSSSERPHMEEVYNRIQNAIRIESRGDSNPPQSSHSHFFSTSNTGDSFVMSNTILPR